MRILIADDQPDVLTALRFLLKAEGFSTVSASQPAEIMERVRESPPDLILMDLNYTRDTTSGQEGLDVLGRLEQFGNTAPVVVMTAWGSVELAVEAMRRGAADFVMKPWDNQRLLATVNKHLTNGQPAVTKASRDLDLARQVQLQLLPQRLPPIRTLDYDGFCRQAGAVGGDYYDFLELSPGRLGLVLADISGKGISAALLMANLQAALRSLVWQADRNLGLLVRTLNLQFCESSTPERFATIFIGVFEEETRRLRYANCGHNPPLVLRRSGETEKLGSTAMVIGLMRDLPVEVRDVELKAGDRLAIYSDGVTEAPGPDGAELGEDRFADLLRAYPDEKSEQITARIATFGGPQQSDDMTLVLARVL
jgi:phosphoserine phosphatase RsbU/P